MREVIVITGGTLSLEIDEETNVKSVKSKVIHLHAANSIWSITSDGEKIILHKAWDQGKKIAVEVVSDTTIAILQKVNEG